MDSLRDLARSVAADLSGTASAGRTDGALGGWRLWAEILHKGNTEPRGGAASFGWWHYRTVLALTTDGEVVSFEETDGTMRCPNHEPQTPRAALDDYLAYPDVERWEQHREVDDYPARRIIDELYTPQSFKTPRGQALRESLERLRAERPAPEALTAPAAVSVRPSAPKKEGLFARLFGA